MSLDWLMWFLWIALTRISSQHREEGSDVTFLRIANNSMMKNVSYSVKPYLNYNCACYNQGGEIYNLASLQNTEGTPSFTVNSTTGHSYSYNPCSSFRLGPKDGGCQTDVAICWWVPNGSPKSYVTIGNQDKEHCVGGNSDKPSLVYRTTGEYRYKKSTVRLKCDAKKRKKDEAVFEFFNESEWIFQLTHLCCCANGCPINPDTTTTPDTPTTPPHTPTTPDRSDVPRIIIPVAVSAGTTLVLVPFLVWLMGKRQNRRINDDDEGRPLLGNRAQADQREPNAIPERNPIPERHPIPVSSAGRAEGSSSIESDTNISSANV